MFSDKIFVGSGLQPHDKGFYMSLEEYKDCKGKLFFIEGIGDCIKINIDKELSFSSSEQIDKFSDLLKETLSGFMYRKKIRQELVERVIEGLVVMLEHSDIKSKDLRILTYFLCQRIGDYDDDMPYIDYDDELDDIVSNVISRVRYNNKHLIYVEVNINIYKGLALMLRDSNPNFNEVKYLVEKTSKMIEPFCYDYQPLSIEVIHETAKKICSEIDCSF
jgi:hypothetical protein